MENTSTREVSFRQASTPPPARVGYPMHLWHTAWRDTWKDAVRAETRLMITTSLVFSVTAGVTWRVFASPSILHGVLSALAGAAALALYGGVMLAAHFLYWTPKKLCLAKQRQLEEVRARHAAEMDRTNAALTAREKKVEELQVALKAMKYETEGIHSQIGDDVERPRAMAS